MAGCHNSFCNNSTMFVVNNWSFPSFHQGRTKTQMHFVFLKLLFLLIITDLDLNYMWLKQMCMVTVGVWCRFIVWRCRHCSGEGVRLQRVLGSSQRPVRSVWLHRHHEIWQRWRLRERDTWRTVHQPSLPGTASYSWSFYCVSSDCQWLIFTAKLIKPHFTGLFSTFLASWGKGKRRGFVHLGTLAQCSITHATLYACLCTGFAQVDSSRGAQSNFWICFIISNVCLSCRRCKKCD